LLNPCIRGELFESERRIYTKVQDETPALYHANAGVSNSLISAGCIIEGNVENSIIFRSTHIKPGASVKNCIIMQHCMVGAGASLANVISDKYVEIGDGVQIIGNAEHPIILGKNQEMQ
jgi:glucose-1-phosphate adenylyltransferase